MNQDERDLGFLGWFAEDAAWLIPLEEDPPLSLFPSPRGGFGGF